MGYVSVPYSAYNTTVHKATKRTHFQTLFGYDYRLSEIQRIIENASEDKLPTCSLMCRVGSPKSTRSLRVRIRDIYYLATLQLKKLTSHVYL